MTRYPERLPGLMAYMSNIAQASSRYRWPSWVIYDINFRQAAAGSGSTDWSKTDPSLYTMVFQNMSGSQEGWCLHCYSTEHTSELCMHKPNDQGQHIPHQQKSQEQWEALQSAENITCLTVTAVLVPVAGTCTHAKCASNLVTLKQSALRLPLQTNSERMRVTS